MTSKTTNEKDQKDDDDIDVDDLLTQLSAEELEMLSKEVDPDVRCILLLFMDPQFALIYFIFQNNFRTNLYLPINAATITAIAKPLEKWTKSISATILVRQHWKYPINLKMCHSPVKRY